MNSNMMDGSFDFDQELIGYPNNGYAMGDLIVGAGNNSNGFDIDFFTNSFVNPSNLNMDNEGEFKALMNFETPRMDNLPTSLNLPGNVNDGSEFPFPGSTTFTTASTTPINITASHLSNAPFASHPYGSYNTDPLPGLDDLPKLDGFPGQNRLAVSKPSAVEPGSARFAPLQDRCNRSQPESAEACGFTEASVMTMASEAPGAEQPKPKRKRGARKKIRSQAEQEHRRQMHLKRNREAAQKCRAKKKGWEQRLQNDLEDQRRENQRLWDLHEEVTKQYDEIEQIVKAADQCAHGSFKEQVGIKWNGIQKRKLDVAAALADIRNSRVHFPRAEYEQEQDDQDEDMEDLYEDDLSKADEDSHAQFGMDLPPTSEQQREYMLQAARRTIRPNDGTAMSRSRSNDSAVADLSKSSKSPDTKDGSMTPETKMEEVDSQQPRLHNQRLFGASVGVVLKAPELPPWQPKAQSKPTGQPRSKGSFS